MALLAALVWAFRPLASNFTPAPLQPVPKGCPLGSQEFVPSNLTALPDLPLEKLPPKVKNRVLLRLNMEPCNCGCARSIAACLASDPPCETAKELAKKILAEEEKRDGLDALMQAPCGQARFAHERSDWWRIRTGSLTPA